MSWPEGREAGEWLKACDCQSVGIVHWARLGLSWLRGAGARLAGSHARAASASDLPDVF